MNDIVYALGTARKILEPEWLFACVECGKLVHFSDPELAGQIGEGVFAPIDLDCFNDLELKKKANAS